MIERELKQQAAAKDRLAQYSMITPMEKNNAKIELLRQNIETIKNETAALALIKAIELLSREY